MPCILSFVFLLFIAVVSGSSDCSKFDFPCENGQCIDMVLWCDSVEDCTDGSDEKLCKKSSNSNPDPNECPSSYYKCTDGPCIPIFGRCDGYESCEDSSDEENCEIVAMPTEGSSTSLTSKPVTSPLERTTPTATRPTIDKQDSQATRLLDSAHTMSQSVQIQYSDLRPSDYSRQRESALNWLLSRQRDDFGWGDETPRAITALYLSAPQQPIRKNESDVLMIKQLEVQLSLDLARNGTKAMKLTDLSLYINSLVASCKDPMNFYGENLVHILRNGVNAAQREAIFVNPSVYLTLCINNATTFDDMRKLHEIFSSGNTAMQRIDIQSLALLTITCIFRNTNYLVASAYDSLRRQFISKINASVLPGNVYESSLLAQAFQELKMTQPSLLESILKQQREDGSFGDILATYLVLPVLSKRSFLQMSDHCSQRYATDIAPIDVLQNPKRKKMYVQYSLNYGYPPEMTETINMKVAEGINFLDIMRLAQEVNPKFRFMLNENRNTPVIYSIGGIPNDAEKGMFWTLYLASSKTGAGRLAPYSGNIKQLMPNTGDEFVFWFRSL